MSLSREKLNEIRHEVLSILHTNNPCLTFWVMVYRDDPSLQVYLTGPFNDDTLLIRSAFFNNNGVEFAALLQLDAADPNYNKIAFEAGEKWTKSMLDKMDEKNG